MGRQEELGGQQTADAGEMRGEATPYSCPPPTSPREAPQPDQGSRTNLTLTSGSPHPPNDPRSCCH